MPQTLRGSFEQALRPLPSVVKDVQACRLPGLKCLKRCAAASSRHSGHCHLFFTGFKPAVCQASHPRNPSADLFKATTLTATCPCHLFFKGFKTAVRPASNPPNPSAGLSKATTLTATCPFQGNNSYSYMPLPSVFQGVQDCRLPGFKPSKPSRKAFQGNNSYSYMPLPSVFQGVQDCRLPGFKPSKPFRRPFQGNNSYSYMPLPFVFQGVQDCRLPGFTPSKPFRRPFQGNNSYSYMPFPRQQLLQLHPFARLQTLQTPQQASKATTLTATCPCHLRLYVFIYVVVSSFIHKDVYIYIYICLQSVRIPSSALKGGRRHQGVSPFIYMQWKLMGVILHCFMIIMIISLVYHKLLSIP